MDKIELEIVALSHSITQSHSYAVVLGESKGVRRLPIVIGGFEAQAIAVALEKMNPSRPLTHDLMRNLFETFNIELQEIVINNLKDGIFYSQLVCFDGKNTVVIDSRTSDALALAVRFNCPIFTYESILDTAGIIMEDPDLETGEDEAAREEVVSPAAPEEAEVADSSDITKLSKKELNALLKKSLEKEDYEKAARIRDEIEKRKS